ncbi:MAG: thioredoxin [Candidatus Micrarchaeia archaeon]
MAIKDVEESNFESEVLKSDIPVVIDLWAEWCGPCRMFSPEIEEAAKVFEGKAKFVKINVDNNPNIASKYNIMSIPTTLIIQNGEVKAESVGALPKQMLISWLKKYIKD